MKGDMGRDHGDGMREARDGDREYVVRVWHVKRVPQSFPSTLTEGIQTFKDE